MPNWVLFALGAVVLWGIWGLLLKLAVDRLGPDTAFLVHSLAFTVWVLLYKLATGFPVTVHKTGMVIATAAAVFASSGALLLAYALARSKASSVIPFIALYPALTVVLSLLILKERMTGPQWLGVAFAVLAGFFLSR